MRYLITGAGQIGSQLAHDLVTAGHTVTVVRRSPAEVPGTTTVTGDVADRDLLRRTSRGADAIFHCVHTDYDARAWARDLPQREAAVMDVAAERGIPVVFPESVYAFGRGARDLAEGADPAPASPLGGQRKALLEARRKHPATTLSLVAADLVGPTADPKTSVYLLLVLGAVAKGRAPWVMGDPDAPRTVTYIPDMTRAMAYAAEHAGDLAPEGDAVLNVPSPGPVSQRRMAADAADALGLRAPAVHRIPNVVFRAGGLFMPMMRELANQNYLWRDRAVLVPGMLCSEDRLAPTPWEHIVGEWAAGVRESPQDHTNSETKSAARP